MKINNSGSKSKKFFAALIILVALFTDMLNAQSPAITSFSPSSGSPGTLFTITGSNLASPTAFTVGGTNAIVISNSGTILVGLIMPGTVTGTISVITAAGTASSSSAFTMTPTAYPTLQQGTKLVGTGATGVAAQGNSVCISADGNTAIVGGNTDNSNAGAAWIYSRSGGVWTQQGNKLVGTGAIGAAGQGISVGISADGNTAIVGGSADSSSAGAAWIFTRSGTTWTQQGVKLAGTGDKGSANRGYSASLSANGNTAVLGGYGDNGNIGAIWVFVRSAGVWSQQGSKLVGTGPIGLAGQGWSVAISSDGNTIIEGGYYDNSGLGAAWVFTRSGAVWTQQGAKLVGTGGVGLSELGWSVGISSDGNTAIVGGYFDNSTAGAAWVFTRASGVWAQQGNKLVGTGSTGSANQGVSVGISADGNTAIIGGNKDKSNAGAVWVFTRSGGVWAQQGSKLAGTGSTGVANQGFSVAISSDGNTTIVGGNQDNTNAGAAWVFVPCLSPTMATLGASSLINCGSRSTTLSILSGTLNSATFWQWYSGLCGGTKAGIGTSLVVSPVSTTTYFARGEGCGTPGLCSSITITENALPDSTTSLSGAVISANLTGGVYQWLDCNKSHAVIAGATNQSLKTTANGSYAVMITKNGCTDTSACVKIINTEVDNRTENTPLFSVYPNPASGVFYIQSASEGVYSIVNSLGQTVQSFKLNSVNNYAVRIENLSKGFYFIVGKDNSRVSGQKVVVY